MCSYANSLFQFSCQSPAYNNNYKNQIPNKFLSHLDHCSSTTLWSSYSTKSFTIENKTSGARYLTGESVSNYIPTTVQLSENVQKKKISQLYSENLFRKRVKEILYRAGGPITITTPLAVSVFAF